jgi:putative membrane protein
MGLNVFSTSLPLASIPHEMQALGYALFGTAAFGLLGVLLMLAGFKAFEVLTRRLDVEKQLEAGNMAVGVTVGSLLLGVSVIVVVSML